MPKPSRSRTAISSVSGIFFPGMRSVCIFFVRALSLSLSLSLSRARALVSRARSCALCSSRALLAKPTPPLQDHGGQSFPTPYTLHPTPYTLHPIAPYTGHSSPTPYTHRQATAPLSGRIVRRAIAEVADTGYMSEAHMLLHRAAARGCAAARYNLALALHDAGADIRLVADLYQVCVCVRACVRACVWVVCACV